MRFELFVAVRYLRAKRKQTAISLITFISIVSVAAGVAALVIAFAINTGSREELQKKLLGSQAHVQLTPKSRGAPISDYIEVTKQVERTPGVIAAAPSLYQKVLIHSDAANEGVVLKGILPEFEVKLSSLSEGIVKGSLKNFAGNSIILGEDLANTLGVFIGDRVRVTSSETTLSPVGAVPRSKGFQVVAIFKSGLYELDTSWVYIPLSAAQALFGQPDIANTIEVRIRDIYQAPAMGEQLAKTLGRDLQHTDWIHQYQSIFQALALEKLVMSITIGLIVIVAALNIVATLIMMVLEKSRDIAVLMSMGATRRNIRKIFIFQGVVIGVVGTFFGLIVGHVVSAAADRYHLFSLPADVYSIAYVPFHPNPIDSVIIAASAILISFLATLYPSAAAAKLEPVEALRYE